MDAPQQLSDAPAGSEVWVSERSRFALPKVELRILLSMPKHLVGTARFEALRRLHVELSSRALERETEAFAYCGLGWSLHSVPEGYQFSVSGYSEHAPTLVELLGERLARPTYLDHKDVDMFQRVKAALLAEVEDMTSLEAYEHASEALTVLLTSSAVGRLEVAAELRNLTRDSVLKYIDDFDHLHLQVLFAGNVNEAIARAMASTLVGKFRIARSVADDQTVKSLVVRVGRQTELHLDVPNPIAGDAESAVINVYQYGVPDIAERVRLMMLGQMVRQPIYDTLRTQQQLGYVVFGTMASRLSTMELRVVVQGSKEEPDEVDRRIEAVLQHFGKELGKLSVEEFSKWKAASRSALLEEDLNLKQEADRMWGQVASGRHCFNFTQLALAYLDAFDSPSLLATTFENLWREPRKVSVRLHGVRSNATAVKGQGEDTLRTSLLQGSTTRGGVQKPKRTIRTWFGEEKRLARSRVRRRGHHSLRKHTFVGKRGKSNGRRQRIEVPSRAVAAAAEATASSVGMRATPVLGLLIEKTRPRLRASASSRPVWSLAMQNNSVGVKTQVALDRGFWPSTQLCEVRQNSTA
mmetsp:Transcript_101163/g.285207  ORF Transcript_101163/g.285207 Transcript_101163/m.285207 type:complete len:581 (-) Transcript_101163:94-1836(-)